MADEKDPKKDEAAEAEPKKPRAPRRKPKPAAAKAEPAAAAAAVGGDDRRRRRADRRDGRQARRRDDARREDDGRRQGRRRRADGRRRGRRQAQAGAPHAPQGRGRPARRARRQAASARPRATADGPPMVRAHAKYVRTSARKARLVCDHIRGKSVDEARAILAHASRDVARDWSKLLESAVANAEHNHELIGDDLRIHAVKADEGPTLKRFRPRAMGRATKIRKRTSHLSITLTPKDGE